MKKLYCKRKYSISLIIVFSLFIQLFVPFFSVDANAVGSDEQIRNENGVILVDRNNTYEETEFYKDSLFGIAGGFHLVGLDTIEPAEEEIISEESDQEEIVTEEEVEEKPVAKVVQVEARNSGSGFSSLTPIYNESTGEFEIRFQYDLEKVQPGDEFTVDIDSTYIDLEELQDGVNYTVIKDGSTYKIKFKDEFSGANQGIISIKTQTKEVDKSDEYKIEWKLDDENFFETIFIKKPGDSESDIRGEKSSKNVQSNWELGNKIKGEVNEDGEQFITVEDDITSVDIPYTLVYETTTGGKLNIKDELDDLLKYNKGSFTAKLESWDDTGWNKTTTTVDLASYLNISGNSFTISDYELPANSRITINYNANVKDAKALETHLNQLLEEKQLDGEEGSVSYVFNNKAKINDEDRDGNYSGNVNVPGEKPEVKPEYPSNVLEKYVDPTTANATFDNEGKLIPIPVTYTLKLNMSKFNGDNIKQLTDNLILTDNLDPNHKVEFELSDVTIISDGGVTVQEGDVDETDKTIGNYSIENKQFKFNAGKEPADYTIILKGNITALNNQKDYWSPLPFFDYYSYKNTAVAKAGEDLIGKGEATTTVIDKKGQTTITDSNVFNKGHKTNPTTPVIGEPIEITYTFTVNDWNAGANAVDVSKSTITDIIDPIFDTSKGYEITLSDNWNGQSLDYITHSLKDGKLTIDFADNMPENIKKARWVINITLTTFPITEQSQALIRNSASLTGSDSGLDYSSSTETSGQTTGGELLVRKTVTDLDNINYRKNYTLELDSDGNPKHKEFNYKIDLIPQVDYRNVKILPLTDVLPEALEFVGLIGSWESDTATVNRTTEDYANTGGKVEVTYENGELKIANNTSTFGSGSISIRFRVKLKDSTSLKAGDIISNVITSQDPPANITVVEPGKYPINITKVDSETGERIEDKNQVARFKLEKVGEDGTKTTVYNEIRIVSGQLVDAQGKALVVESIGNYLLTETKAPTGYILSEEPISIRVTENGTIPGQIEVQNTPGVDPEPETTEISVEKKWIGTEGENITVNLLANEEKIKDVVLSSANNWKHTFTDLPTVNDVTGEAINYTVEEVEIEGYESSIAGSAALGFVITNIFNDVERENITATKQWGGTQPGSYPVHFSLYRTVKGETGAPELVETKDLSEGTELTFENMPKYAPEGATREYEYFVKEVDDQGNDFTPQGYIKHEDGLTVVNRPIENPTISVTKILEGRPLIANEFEFVLTDVTGENSIATARNDAQGNVVFSNFLNLNATQLETLKANGTLTLSYTIQEVANGREGVTYDTTVYPVNVILTYNQETESYDAVTYEETATFTNTYTATPAEINLEVEKNLIGQPIEAGQFTFELEDEAGEKTTVQNDADGSVQFPVTFDEVGKYTYNIREVEGTQGGMAYDNGQIIVVVDVVDNGEGQFVATPNYIGNRRTFTNTYTFDPANAVIEAEKVLNGKDLVAGQFSFQLVDADNNVIETVENEADGSIAFSALTFDVVGEYQYTIREVQKTVRGYTYDTKDVAVTITVTDNREGQYEAEIAYAPEAVFTNNYQPLSTELVLEGTKELIGVGRELAANEFNFEVVDTEEKVVATATNDADGKVVFTSIAYDYTAIGTHEYTIREVAGSDTNITYDETGFTITVTVTDVEGQLEATVETDGEVVFENIYTPHPTTVELEMNKELDGRDLVSGEFDFEVVEGNAVVATGTNAADGKVTFTEIEFTKAGTHEYTIREVIGTDDNITYDETTIEVTVTVVDVEGQLEATATYPTDVSFNNVYTPHPVEVSLEASKELAMRELEAEEFTFEVVDTDNNVIATATNNEDGKIDFPVTFTEVGTYEFIIREVAGTDSEIVYDETTFNVTVEVIDEAGQLVATVTYEEKVEFNNLFDPPRVSVGDYVWIDENKDGLQDATDTPIAGVVLYIVDENGKPVTDVYGKPVGPTTTDEKGWYTFKDLPIDKTYTVHIDREASKEALKGIIPTKQEVGEDNSADSSTWKATSEFMDKDGKHDPTLDFGFIRPSVSVGDYVWIDENKDGLQDATDTPIPGVVLEIFDENGKPVTDVYGKPVGPTTTDKNGWYTFKDLPVGKTYTVKINREASKEALKGIVPTKEESGEDNSIDSSSWLATSVKMTEDGQHDPTLDFGFVLFEEEPIEPEQPEVPSEPGEPDVSEPSVETETSEETLPYAGAVSRFASTLAGMALLASGTSILYFKKRKKEEN